MRSRALGLALALGVLLSATLLAWPKIIGAGSVDPDRHYHLAVSRQAVQGRNLFPQAVPQVQGIGWGEAFPEKEFLFHVLTTQAYRVAGPKGVEGLIPILMLALFSMLLAACARWISPLAALGVLVAVVFTDSRFVHRVAMLRPHLLAVTFFVGLLASLIYRRLSWVAAFGFLFAMAYHAIYVPLFALAAFAWLTGRAEPRRSRFLLFGSLGVLAGVMLNPFFPGNVLMGIRHAQIALFEVGSAPLSFGHELLPMASPQFFGIYGMAAALLVAGWIVLAYREPLSRVLEKTPDLAWLSAVALVFFALATKNPRAIEFGTPALACAAACLLSILPRTPRRAFVAAGLATLVLARVPGAWADYAKTWSGSSLPLPQDELMESLAKVPAKSAKIFNCEWDVTPYILDSRPKFSFVDILDPSFLYMANRDLHTQRESLREGRIVDPYALIRAAGYDHVLCRAPDAIAQLERDPNFVRIFPEKSGDISGHNGGNALYAVVPRRDPRFVEAYEGVPLESLDASSMAGFATQAPSPGLPWRKLELPTVGEAQLATQAVFLDLRKELKKVSQDRAEKAPTQVSCFAVRPAKDQAALQAGRVLIGVGGGRNVRLWLNGKPLYSSQVALPGPRLVSELVRLKRPLRADDRLEAIVCSQAASSYMGLALSFWTDGELAETCKRKKYAASPALADERGWSDVGGLESSCLGPIARRR